MSASGVRLGVDELRERGPRSSGVASTGDIKGGKGGVFYRAHSYHTKVPIEGLVRLIEHYTEPGDFIADPFCGSGQTGVAAILTGRHAILSDLSPAAVHIAKGYTAKVSPDEYRAAIALLFERLAPLEADLYGPTDRRIEYTVWSDIYACPTCETEISFWSAAVDHEAGTVQKTMSCTEGHGPFKKPELEWLRSVPVQQNISDPNSRKRLVVDVKASDVDVRHGRSEISQWYPTSPWDEWREMWRAQHQNMQVLTAADFYTDKNLTALTALWDEIDNVSCGPEMKQALRFSFTSIANRASRRYQWHPTRPTNVLSSTMYIAALNYEFNVFSLFRRKTSTIAKMYEQTFEAPGTCQVHQGSATKLDWIPDSSLDYVFTDPPFGSNIFYGDSSFLWEAWLDDQTDVAAETVVNKRLKEEHGHSTLDDYEKDMSLAMSEIARGLRTNGWVSLQFHNSDDAVWSRVQSAVESAALKIDSAVVMDKGQASFKGLRHESKGEKVANFDLVMHLERSTGTTESGSRPVADPAEVVAYLRRYVSNNPPSRRTTPWLHSQVMRFLLEQDANLDGWSFGAVEELCNDLFQRKGNAWQEKS